MIVIDWLHKCEDGIHHAGEWKFQTQNGGERRAIHIRHVAWLHQWVFTGFHQGVFVVFDGVWVINAKAVAVFAALYLVVGDVLIFTAAERAGMHEWEVTKIEEVVHELPGRCLEVNGGHPHVS